MIEYWQNQYLSQGLARKVKIIWSDSGLDAVWKTYTTVENLWSSITEPVFITRPGEKVKLYVWTWCCIKDEYNCWKTYGWVLTEPVFYHKA